MNWFHVSTAIKVGEKSLKSSYAGGSLQSGAECFPAVKPPNMSTCREWKATSTYKPST